MKLIKTCIGIGVAGVLGLMKLIKTCIGIGVAGVLGLSGCKSFSDYQEERIAYAVRI